MRVFHGSSKMRSSQVRIHECSGDCWPMRSSRSISLLTVFAAFSGRSSSATLVRYCSDDVVVTLTELLADRCQLLAQQVLALLLVDAFGDVGADLCGDLQFGEMVLGPRGDQIDALADVDGGEHRDLVIGLRLAPRRDGVGQLARLDDAAQDLGQAAAVAQLGDLFEHDAQLARRGLDPRRRPGVGEQLDLDVVGATLARVAGDDARPHLGLHDGGHLAVGHRPGVGHPGDDADVAGGLVVQHQPAIAGRGGLHRGAGGVGRQGEGEDRAGKHHRRHCEKRQSELASVEIGHTWGG